MHRPLEFRQRRVYFMYHLVPLHPGLEMVGFSWQPNAVGSTEINIFEIGYGFSEKKYSTF